MEFARAFCAHLLVLMPGSTSVNELRVFTAIGLATLKEEHVGITELSNQLGIPLSTTSRLVSRLSSEGKVVAIKHLRDDRRRGLRFAPHYLDDLSAWARDWLAIRERVAQSHA